MRAARSPMLGPCFACNEYGHIRSNCPKMAMGVGCGTMYPSNDVSSVLSECNVLAVDDHCLVSVTC